MRRNYRIFAIISSTLVLGCGAGGVSRTQTAAIVTPAHAGEARVAEAEQSASAPQAEPAPGAAAPSAGWFEQDAHAAVETAEPQYRPGLATSWGENRTSPVSTAPFMRASNEPFSVVQFFYNDARGVKSMMRTGPSARDGDGSLSTPDGALSVRLLDGTGRPLPSMTSRGRTYVIGQQDRRYAIEVQNNTPNRFEVVATVDGLDVIDGQPGSFGKRGYLIRGWSRLVIDGFRQSYRHVAAFRFGAVRDSYAAKTGDATNVGVIGLAFFDEHGRDHVIDQHEAERRRRADPFPARFAQPPR
jgi:hypothetical protein